MKNIDGQNKISESRAELLGVATLLVLSVHATSYNWEAYPSFLYKLFGIGSIGVDVFLLLSGIGLYYSMKKCGNIIEFYKHRIIRILPSYLFIAGILFGIINLMQNLSVKEYLFRLSTLEFWVYGKGAFPLWYVPFTIFLYLLYPIIYKILIGKNGVQNIFILIITIILIEICLFTFASFFYLEYEIAISRIPIFLIGTIYGKCEYEGKRYPLFSLFAYGASFIFIRIMLVYFGNSESDLYQFIIRKSYIPGALAIAEFIPYIQKIMPNNPIRCGIEALGAVSFEIYMVHVLFSNIYRLLKIYQIYNSPLAYLIFVVLPSIIIVMLTKYFLQKVKNRNKLY